MQQGEWLQELGRVYELALGAMPSSNTHSYAASVGVGVAVTAVAGVAVAAAVGGLIYYNGGELPFDLPFSTRRYHSPLTEEKWLSCFDPNEEKLVLGGGERFILKVRGGGIEPSIRAQVWPFLLGVYDLDSTSAERDVVKFTKREEYEALRAQCGETLNPGVESIEGDDDDSLPKGKDEGDDDDDDDASPKGKDVGDGDSTAKRKEEEEEEGFQTWRRIIRLDAVRMNAEWIPYAETQASVTVEEAAAMSRSAGLMDDDHLEPPRRHHAARLVLILEAYTRYDSETGYCQGMSDLLSPFVALIDDDYLAFWCFVKFMEYARHNFRMDEVGIRRQLNMVSSILKAVDPQVYQHLVKLGCEDCTFVYRMVVVLMRRELSFEQTLCLWEVMWADWAAMDNQSEGAGPRRGRDRLGPPSRDLLLYTIAAAVRKKRRKILQYCGMDELVRECNDMAGNLDIWELLADARELVRCVQARHQD